MFKDLGDYMRHYENKVIVIAVDGSVYIDEFGTQEHTYCIGNVTEVQPQLVENRVCMSSRLVFESDISTDETLQRLQSECKTESVEMTMVRYIESELHYLHQIAVDADTNVHMIFKKENEYDTLYCMLENDLPVIGLRRYKETYA